MQLKTEMPLKGKSKYVLWVVCFSCFLVITWTLYFWESEVKF